MARRRRGGGESAGLAGGGAGGGAGRGARGGRGRRGDRGGKGKKDNPPSKRDGNRQAARSGSKMREGRRQVDRLRIVDSGLNPPPLQVGPQGVPPGPGHAG